MPNKKICTNCKGSGYVEVLINQHDDEKEIITCGICKGKKVIYQMTDDEERDYHDDYW